MKHSSAAATIRWLAVCACALLLSTATVHETTARQPDAQTPQQFFGFRIGTDGELARYPKILEYFQHLAKTTDRVKYRGARQDDDGESVRAGDDQLAGEPGEVRSARRDQPAAGRSARAVGGGSARSSRRRAEPFYLRLRDDPLDRGRQHARRSSTSSTGWRPTTAPRFEQILDNVVLLVVPSQNPDGQVPRHRSLVQDEGHAVHARLSGPVPQVRRPRRQPRLVHVHAEGDAHEHREGAEQVQADHHARHAPAGRDRLAHLRAAVRRSVRSEHAPDSAQGIRRRSARRWRSALVAEGKDGRRVAVAATTCGRRRGSTWSTTASRAS